MDITEQSLNQIYDNMAKEQMKLMTSMKNRTDQDDKKKEAGLTKQLSLINTIMVSVLRLRNVRKDLATF